MSDPATTTSATPAAEWQVRGTQTVTGGDGQCRVDVQVIGKARGTIDRGNGVDQLRVSVWDDGEEKDFRIVTVALGTTSIVDVRLGFSGRYDNTAGGIGITVAHGTEASDESLFSLDPFFPKDVQAGAKPEA